MLVSLHTDDPIKLHAFATCPITSLWFWSMLLLHLSPCRYLGVPKSSPWHHSQMPSKTQLGFDIFLQLLMVHLVREFRCTEALPVHLC